MALHPLDYAVALGPARRGLKADAVAFASGALLAGFLLAIYFGLGNPIVFKVQSDWGDIVFWPGYQFGYLVYDELGFSYELSLAAGIAATVLVYGLSAVILIRIFTAVQRLSRRSMAYHTHGAR